MWNYEFNSLCRSVKLSHVHNVFDVFPPFPMSICAQPVAAGSGIPEIKCYLNGVKVSQLNMRYSYLLRSRQELFT